MQAGLNSGTRFTLFLVRAWQGIFLACMKNCFIVHGKKKGRWIILGMGELGVLDMQAWRRWRERRQLTESMQTLAIVGGSPNID